MKKQEKDNLRTLISLLQTKSTKPLYYGFDDEDEATKVESTNPADIVDEIISDATGKFKSIQISHPIDAAKNFDDEVLEAIFDAINEQMPTLGYEESFSDRLSAEQKDEVRQFFLSFLSRYESNCIETLATFYIGK